MINYKVKSHMEGDACMNWPWSFKIDTWSFLCRDNLSSKHQKIFFSTFLFSKSATREIKFPYVDNLLSLCLIHTHTCIILYFFESAHQVVSSSLKLKHDINHQNVVNDALIHIYICALPIFISENQDTFLFFSSYFTNDCGSCMCVFNEARIGQQIKCV